MWDFQDFFILIICSSLRSLLFCFVPPPPLEAKPEGVDHTRVPLVPRCRFRPSNNGRHNRIKYKGTREKFLLLGRHHVLHIPSCLGRPVY